MDAQTIDQEFEKLQAEFQDVATAVQTLATKLQDAQKAGDANAGEWLSDLEAIAKEVDDEQSQAKTLLLALHSFIAGPPPAGAPANEGHQPLFAQGQDPFPEGQQQQQQPQRSHGLLGGLLGGMGGMGGGGMGGAYMGGGFGRAMEMGVGMQLGADLVGNIFR